MTKTVSPEYMAMIDRQIAARKIEEARPAQRRQRERRTQALPVAEERRQGERRSGKDRRGKREP